MVFAFAGDHITGWRPVWMFPGLEPQYRCRVPECEAANSSTFTQEGRGQALPSW